MSAAGHAGSAPDASAIAARLRDADFVRLFATPDGDALAATGLLARALAACDVAYQASVTHDPGATDADLTVAVGHRTGDLELVDAPLAVAAHAVARELGAPPDATLALAGVVAAGAVPGAHADLLSASGLERRPGLAVPTDDVAEGLAHTTLAHASFSGDPEATARALAGVDREGRTLASLLALSTVEDATGAPRAAGAVERALRPYVTDGPFETLGGFADVLDAVARSSPGVGVALALGHDCRDAALSAWRDHAQAAHEAVRATDRERYDGLVVVRPRLDDVGALDTVARLVRDFRSPEPVVLALCERRAAVAGVEDVTTLVSETAAATGGRATGRGSRVHVDLDDDPEPFVETLKRGVSR
ncbi:hypothetical protein [Halomarina ordinaria]|uniref:Exonuclease RecJ n=1 Tax=Halomarina ordinaria TaxID=3033939 RepID=A0ABD5U9Z5_9EURY|nr:hypothetical protein [Halomarina sp. PSRA2]